MSETSRLLSIGCVFRLRELLQSVRDQDANYAKLGDIEEVLALIRGKYGAQAAT